MNIFSRMPFVVVIAILLIIIYLNSILNYPPNNVLYGNNSIENIYKYIGSSSLEESYNKNNCRYFQKSKNIYYDKVNSQIILTHIELDYIDNSIRKIWNSISYIDKIKAYFRLDSGKYKDILHDELPNIRNVINNIHIYRQQSIVCWN